ncbi:MAG: D-tyrosyl-tRNA(Tyr) deacylase [Chlorobi bacterium]|nr:D-tyrosyl-tRNA(Tyr) deacylase [Chlorobiota bacterium]
MRAVIQRVSESSVQIEGSVTASIGNGLLIFLGIEHNDNQDDVEWLAKKICQLRIFNDDSGIMNLSLIETGGEALVVSQFTLHAKTRKGNRPSYIRAARPEQAIPLYEKFISEIGKLTKTPAKTGVFGAKMIITLKNDGPVTIIIDTRQKE